jgi:hypothetical protein
MWVNISVDMAYMINEPTPSYKRYWTKQCHKFTVTVPLQQSPFLSSVFVPEKKMDVNPKKGAHNKR